MPNGGVLLEAGKEYQKQYRLSSWWIEHRDGLKRLGLILFACVDGIFLLVAGWAFVDAYAVSYADEQRSVLEIVAYGQSDLRAYSVATAAEDLDLGGTTVVASSEGKYDLYATIANPNDDWRAEFTYAFTSSAGDTEPASGFVLPGEEKPVVAYAVEASATPRSASLVISDVVWHRVDHHVTGDLERWMTDRLNFVVENAAFERVDLDGETLGRVTFAVKNDSAYSYYEPAFTATLLRGSSVVGVTGTTLSELDAGEEQEVVINWFGTIPSVNKVEVSVSVNPFDISSYKPLEGETTEDTRTRIQLRGRR